MKADFPDLDLIVSLGCGSAINMPIVAAGEMLGSVNLLHEEGWYGPERVAASQRADRAGHRLFPASACPVRDLTRYVIQRLGLMVTTLFAIITLTFFLMHVVPGGTVRLPTR